MSYQNGEYPLHQNPYRLDTTDPRGDDKPVRVFEHAVIYARTSPRPQPTEASLAKQIDDCRRKAQEKRLEIVGSFVDDKKTGKTYKFRPGLMDALALAKREKAAIIAYDLARISRNLRGTIEIVEAIEEAGSSLMTVSGVVVDTSNPFSRMMLFTAATINNFFLEQNGMLTREALAWRQQQGLITGPTPYGWTKGPDGRAEPHAGQQRLIRWLLWRVENGASLKWCVWELEARGYTRLDGGTMNGPWVDRQLRWKDQFGVMPIELDWYDCLVNYLISIKGIWAMKDIRIKPPILFHRSLVPTYLGEWPCHGACNELPAMDANGRACLSVREMHQLHCMIHGVHRHKVGTKAWQTAMKKIALPATEAEVPEVLRSGFNYRPARWTVTEAVR